MDKQREAFEAWAKTRGYPLHDIVPKHGPTSSMPQTVDRFMEVAYEAWQAAQAQQGWVMVPVEPTQEMIDAAFVDTVQDQNVMRQLGRRRAMRDTYAKLIAAAPKEQTK